MSDEPSAKEKWWAWHRENPDVWKLFEKFTDDVIARGHEHYSAKAIFERIRWHTEIETDGAFKLQNNFTAYYARLFHALRPECDGFFRTRLQDVEKEIRHDYDR